MVWEFTERYWHTYFYYNAGGSRFSHLRYLGWQEVFSDLFAVKRLPFASTTLSRLFGKMKEVEKKSEGLWGYLKI